MCIGDIMSSNMYIVHSFVRIVWCKIEHVMSLLYVRMNKVVPTTHMQFVFGIIYEAFLPTEEVTFCHSYMRAFLPLLFWQNPTPDNAKLLFNIGILSGLGPALYQN
jgi:hypothetical protein